MAVRSFALLQLVTRTPFRRRQTWSRHNIQPVGTQHIKVKLWLCYDFVLIKKAYRRKGTVNSSNGGSLYLCCLRQDVHVLALSGVDVLAEKFQQLRHTVLTARSRQTYDKRYSAYYYTNKPLWPLKGLFTQNYCVIYAPSCHCEPVWLLSSLEHKCRYFEAHW